MFEGKITTAHHALPAAHGPFADEALFAFSWDDLVARLCAAQDLRASLAHVPAAARASFDALAAQHLANRPICAQASGKQLINLDPSAYGKGTGCKDGMSADSAFPAVRGIA